MSELTAFNAYCRANGINANGQFATEDLAPAFSAGYKARQDALRQRVAEFETRLAKNNPLLDEAADALDKLTAERDALKQQRDELLAAIETTLEENGHLADGDDCTLITLKRAIASVKEK